MVSVHHANKSLSLARLCFVLMFLAIGVIIFGRVNPRSSLSAALLFAYFASFALAHVFLGQAAVRSGRSWVYYGLAPVILPVLGGLISFGVLRSKVPYEAGA